MEEIEPYVQKLADTEHEVNLLDYFIVLAKSKKLILSVTFAVAVVSAIYTLFLPILYKASVEVLLPTQETGSNALIQRIGNMMGYQQSASASNLFNPHVLSRLLTSRPVLQDLIEQFDLMKETEEGTTKEDLIEQLSYVIHTDTNRKSSVTAITVIDKSAEKAAEMANALVFLLQKRLQEISISQSSDSRLFLQQQLHAAKEALISAEENMIRFQEKTGVMEAGQQTSSMLEQIASLRREIINNEVQLSVMKTYSTLNNPDRQKIEDTIVGLRAALSAMEHNTAKEESIMSLSDLPSIGTDYIRKLRDLKFAETVYEVMAKQYEAVKLNEANSPQSLIIIESALPEKNRFKPERRKIVMYATFGTFIFMVFLVFTREFFNPHSIDPANRDRLEQLKAMLSFKR